MQSPLSDGQRGCFQQLTQYLSRKHVVWAEHLHLGFPAQSEFRYYEYVLQKIKEADILIAELSESSVQLGFEVGMALEHKKHIICLFKGKEEPELLRSLEAKFQDRRLFIINYTSKDLESQLEIALTDIRKLISQRFTILLPTHILNHLDQVSQQLGMPRSVYIRQLIEREMAND